MPKLSFYIATSTLFLIPVAANDLIFITSTAYNFTLQHISTALQKKEAATLQKRLCKFATGSFATTARQAATSPKAFPTSSYRGNSYGSCREQGRGSGPCLDLGGDNGCAGQWNNRWENQGLIWHDDVRGMQGRAPPEQDGVYG
ncbi:hypothetical protein MY10362_005279 [Beauveria mimosiformis]